MSDTNIDHLDNLDFNDINACIDRIVYLEAENARLEDLAKDVQKDLQKITDSIAAQAFCKANPAILRSARKEKDLTQGEVAAQVGVSVPSIHCYETGKYSPSPEVAIKLVKVLDIFTDNQDERADGEATEKAAPEEETC